MKLAVDTETTGTDFFHGCRAFLVTACDGETNYWFEGAVNCYTREVFWEQETIDELQSLLDSCSSLIFHNSQFDMRALSYLPLKLDHLWDKIEDTLIASHLICSGDTHNLKDLAIKYYHYFDDDETELEEAVKSERQKAAVKGWDIAKKGHRHFPAVKIASWWKQDMWLCPEECLRYALCDVERTWLLWEAFRHGLIQDNLMTQYRTRKRLIKICYDMTAHGMRLNIRATNYHVQSLETEMETIRKGIEKELGLLQKFSWNKRDHLILLLHKHLNFPIAIETKTGSPSVSKDSLLQYAENSDHPLLHQLMRGRKLETELRYVKSYLNWTDDEGYIHSNTNITGTRETRQSSTDPNQQNITGKLKELYQPPPGKVWVEYDFANIELRIWAYTIGNDELIKAFEGGDSVHFLIMEALYPNEAKAYKQNPKNEMLKKLYRSIKAGNFALIYGATEKKADETYGYKGSTSKVFRRFPGIAEFTASKIKECETNARDLYRHSVYTIGNYLLDVPPDEPFKASNYFVQGSAGYMMNLSMCAVVQDPYYLKSECQLVSQVHDSLKPEIPITPTLLPTIYSIANAMETASMKLFGVTPVSYELIYNPQDATNPDLIKVLDCLHVLPF